ncbi:DUF1934 domain-containing protein [Paradesulfitobacterium ferrireducens]|uniref:DUF1934 domain-containing protein n=1 Tax=Paradesulfitobacterium ferrireducens TaxID=2816476 RepID=UPI002E2D4AE6|nr:DUF1934 domain-containing protein [Paradesulfitobacterium ferrireducens]
MQSKALITVEGRQNFPDGDEHALEFVTVGTYHRRKEAYYLVYRESEITGMEGVTTSLKVRGQRVTLNRVGPVKLKQEFEHGVLHRSTYITPYGELWLSILTASVEIDLTAQGGHISLKYDLFVDDELVSHNSLRIRIKGEPPG